VRYTETPAQSAELLRQVLPYMTRHGGTYHPTHYSLWYEYLAETYPKLRKIVDARLTESPTLTSEECASFYEDLSQSRDSERTELLHSGLLTLLGQLGQVATTAGDGTERFATQLAEASRQLASGIDADAVTALVGELGRYTASMQQSTGELTAQVRASQAEINSLKEQLDEAHSAATLDPLTRVNNRRGFDLAISGLQKTESAALASGTLLMADIDHFKRINDSYGHLIGDRVIQAVAQVLVRMTKGGDILVRLGGEEFAILLPSTTVSAGLAVAEQIRAAVARVRLVQAGSGEPLSGITISFGVAGAMAGESLSAWIERADKAMYVSKQGGRNRVTSWTRDGSNQDAVTTTGAAPL
jgi:diguanylate cyclase